MARPSAPIAAHSGFAYIGLLILVAILGVAMAATGETWQITRKRERENELLFIGDQFRQAIRSYVQQQPSRYPTSFDDLLKDPRAPNTRRFLRKVFADPMTDSTDWGLVRGPNGELYGVYSKSEEAPMKVANFDRLDAGFEEAKKYSDWKFIYIPGQAVQSTSNAQPSATLQAIQAAARPAGPPPGVTLPAAGMH